MGLTDLMRRKPEATRVEPSETPAGMSARMDWLCEMANGGTVHLYWSGLLKKWSMSVEVKGRVTGTLAKLDSGWHENKHEAMSVLCRMVREVMRV